MTDTATWNIYIKDKRTGDLQLVLLDEDNKLRFATFDTAEAAAGAVGRLLAQPGSENKDYHIMRG